MGGKHGSTRAETSPAPTDSSHDSVLSKAQQYTDDDEIVLSASQKKALDLALTNKVLVITGGPGVGKTTLVKSILHILSAQGTRVALCAPTGTGG